MKNCSKMNEMMSLYIDNELSADERRKFEKHLDTCPACKKELDDILQIIKLCRDTEEEELPQDFKAVLHRKLMDVQMQESGMKKTSILRMGYVKIISSVAAGILLIFLAKGIYDIGVFTPHNSAKSSNEAMMKSQAAPVEKPDAADAVQSAGNGGNAQFSGKTADTANSSAGSTGSAGFSDITAAAYKSEIGRSATENRDIQAPMLAFAVNAEKAFSTSVTLKISVDDPEIQADKIRNIAAENGGEEIKDAGLNLSTGAAGQAENDKDGIIIDFLIPNIQYDKFAGTLNTNYGQSNIEPGLKVMEELTNKLNELIRQSNDLDSSIKEAETKSETNGDELDKLITNKKNIENDIENIRLGTDFTNVTVILISK